MPSTTFHGAGASPGVAMGPAYMVTSAEPNIPVLEDPGTAFSAAATEAGARLSALADRAETGGLDEAADILRAQSMMATDPMLAEEVTAGTSQGVAIQDAIVAAEETIAAALRASGSEYLAERASDVAEVGRRIRFALAGVEPAALGDMTTPAVVVADSLTAADTASMDPALVLGFVTEGGGPTGHVAVIARALRIPAVVAAPGVTNRPTGVFDVLLDGSTGTVVIDPTEDEREAFEARAAAWRRELEAAAAYRDRSIAFGPKAFSVAANVGNVDDIEGAAGEGADGVGLFRTEFLYLDTPDPPSEDRQFEIYKRAVEAFDHPVVIRTFDIGGDKPARYIEIDPEENPFLGVRGMRLYEQYADLAMAQARALLRAAAFGQLWVMAPMVTTVDDALAVRGVFDEARAALNGEGVVYGDIKLGVMVEVPAAALNARAIADHVDFFSIGTNDLTQYTMAVDRTSAPLAHYLDAADPAVLNLCAMTAAAGASAGISVSVCGEAGSDPGLALLFAGMGMDKLSVTPSAVNRVKAIVDQADPGDVQALLANCLQAESAAMVRGLLGAALE